MTKVTPQVAHESTHASGNQPRSGVESGSRPWRASVPRQTVQGPLVHYRRLVLVGDMMALVVAAVAAYASRYAFFDGRPFSELMVGVGAVLVSIVWLGALAGTGAYDMRVFGGGSEEYRRVLVSSLLLLGAIATVSYAFKLDFSRGFVLLELPLGTTLLLAGRYLARSRLHAWRRAGAATSRVVVVGDDGQVEELERTFAGDPVAGYRAVASVAPPEVGADVDRWADQLHRRVEEARAHAVALASHPRLGRDVVRAVGWRLEGPGVDLLISPEFADIGGPRMTFRPAADVPLIHLDEPSLSGPKRVLKRLMDVIGSITLLVLLSPLLLVTALVVKATSQGPAFFRQRRIGASGEEFRVWKFRTMVQGADSLQTQMWAEGEAAGTANKLKADPRITKVGGVLRRWSIDELPQLLNVLRGDMSLVGPRPLQPVEVDSMPAEYDRRHLTKPGMTGLWQVSGRNDVTWEERMRLDLRYVEHWSVSLDVVILLRTVKAVVSRSGAY